MLLAADILRLVSGVLQDLEPGMAKRWEWAEGGDECGVGLLDFLNAALRAVALQRPDCRAITEAIRLEPGMRQTIPDRRRHGASRDATGFCGLIRNLGRDGREDGMAIMPAQLDILLAWADMARPGCRVESFAYDRSVNPRVYYVHPPVAENAEAIVEATYYAAPDRIEDARQALGISDIYGQALVHHVLASVFAGDSDTSNLAKAGYHMQLFNAEIGAKTQVDLAMPRAKNSIGGAA